MQRTKRSVKATISDWLGAPSKSHGHSFTELFDTFPVGIYFNFLNSNEESSLVNRGNVLFRLGQK